jgi:hypothetical protein
MHTVIPGWRRWLLGCGLLGWAFAAAGQERPEYRLKAAFLYNFALFTEWPASVGNALHLCTLGSVVMAGEVDALQGKAVGERSIQVQHKVLGDNLAACHVLFVAAPAMPALPRVLQDLRGLPVLTVAECAGAARQGAALNMAVDKGKISFEANLVAARAAGLGLSSKLLRLATEVQQ